MTTTPVCPLAPRTLAESGLSQELVLQLLLKHLHFGADFTGQDLARRVGLEFTVIEPVLEVLRFTHLCEVAGGSVVGGPSFRYRITDEGRREVAAREFDLADLQQDLDHSVRELAQEVRRRVHGNAANLREELKAAAKEARATATPAGTSYQQQWPNPATSGQGSTTARDIEAAINAFRYEVRDAARRVSADDGARQEVLDILADAARKIRTVLRHP